MTWQYSRTGKERRHWPVSSWRSVMVDKLNFSQNLSGVGPQHHLLKMWTKHSSISSFSWQMLGIFSTTERIASRVSMSTVVLDIPNLNCNLKSALSVYVTALFVGWTAGAEPEIIWELVCYFRLSTEANWNWAEVRHMM